MLISYLKGCRILRIALWHYYKDNCIQLPSLYPKCKTEGREQFLKCQLHKGKYNQPSCLFYSLSASREQTPSHPIWPPSPGDRHSTLPGSSCPPFSCATPPLFLFLRTSALLCPLSPDSQHKTLALELATIQYCLHSWDLGRSSTEQTNRDPEESIARSLSESTQWRSPDGVEIGNFQKAPSSGSHKVWR